MRVKLLKTHPDAEVPQKAYSGDFCYDLKAVAVEELAPNVYKYHFGLALEMDKGGILNSRIRHAIHILPRSSIWKHGMVLSNSLGVVDEGYRNEITAVFYHVVPTLPKYEVGEHVAQMYVGSTVELDFEQVDSLSQSERGLNGYGSSGK